MATAEPAGFRANRSAPGDVSMTVRGKGPRFGAGSRDKSAPVAPKFVKREASGDSSATPEPTLEQEVDPKDEIIARLQKELATAEGTIDSLKAQLEGKVTAEDDNEDELLEAVDPQDEEAELGSDSPEVHLDHEEAEYLKMLADMSIEQMVAYLEGRGEDLLDCMTSTEDQAVNQAAELLSTRTVQELCELASKRKVNISSCLSVDRGQLMKLLGEALDRDVDSFDHMSDQELCDALLNPDLNVEPATFCDKAKLVAKLTKGIGVVALRELLVSELGVALSQLVDKDKMKEKAAELGSDSSEVHLDHEEAEYLKMLADMSIEQMVAYLEGRGEDLLDCMTSTEDQAVNQAAELLSTRTVKELCELASKRKVNISSCLSVDRGQLMEIFGKVLEKDPDSFDHMSDQELCDALLNPDLNVEPATFCDKAKLVAKLTKGISVVALRELLVSELGVALSQLVDKDKMKEKAAELGLPQENETEHNDEATEQEPKPGDPNWKGSKKSTPVNDDKKAVKALEKLRESARPDWAPGRVENGSWKPPSGTQYWKWQQSAEGKRYTRQLRQEHFNKYASTHLQPQSDASRAVSTMTRSQMNDRLTLAKKLEVTDRFRRNPLLKPKKTCKAGWLYKWRDDARTWRKRWCQVEKVSSGELGNEEPEYALTYRAGKGKRELGSLRLLNGQLRHYGVTAQKKETSEVDSTTTQDVENEVKELLVSVDAKQTEPEQTDGVHVGGITAEASGESLRSVESFRSRMLRTCSSVEEKTRQDIVRIEREIYSLKMQGGSAHIDTDSLSRLGRKARTSDLIAKLRKELWQQEMQLNTIVAAKEDVSVCIVVVEESGKSGLFRTDLPGTQGRVDIHSWYLALKPLLVAQGAEVQESTAEALAMGSYKHGMPDPAKAGRSSRGAYSFEQGGQQAEQIATPVELAVQQSEGNALVLSGHPNAICNGEYHPVPELHDGWPRYESLAGTSAGASMHIFRSIKLNKWFLSRRFVPGSEINNSNIFAEKGPLPTGTQTWRCYVKGEWVEQQLTVEMQNREILQARVDVKAAEASGDTRAILAAKNNLARLVAQEEGDSDDEGSVATTGLITNANAPGTRTVQSVFAARARTRSLVLPDQSKFEPWRNGLRRKRVDMRKELLISSTAKEWIPNGFKKASKCSQESKVESITAGFLYPSENEKPDLP